MTRLRDERGLALTELLVASSLMIVVLGATLTTFDQFNTITRTNQLQNDSQEQARRATDRLSRELRNPTPAPLQPQTIERASGADVVFQTIDDQGAARRVRYCQAAGGSSAILWRQSQAFDATAPLPSTGSCPASSNGPWVDTAVAEGVVNGSRPVFSYVYGSGSSSLTDITAVRTELFVDQDPDARPAETRLASGVYLRNNSRTPVASFTAGLAGQTVTLNAAVSEDPEGGALTYSWSDNGVSFGGGVLRQRELSSGSHVIRLTVTDPTGASATAERTVP